MKQAPRPNLYRDTWCGQVTGERADTRARVAGWVHRRRDHGGLIFIDLRDRSGIVQLVFHPDSAPDAHRAAHGLRSEDVISVAGTVARREPENVNPNIPTGEVEVNVAELDVLADADTPPFPLDEGETVDESLRLKHRSLDLRRPEMQAALALRHRVITTVREVLNHRDFLEIETPDLTRSTPEGTLVDVSIVRRVASPAAFLLAVARAPDTWPSFLPAVSAGPETAEYNVEDALAAEEQHTHGGDDDVLEETPEFLQDTPDHDRLWFEQRPPKDFDFDE